MATKICKCGQTKKKGTTQNGGPNQGREFWTCPVQNRELQCKGAFEWADGKANAPAAAGPRSPEVNASLEKMSVQLLQIHALLSRVVERLDDQSEKRHKSE